MIRNTARFKDEVHHIALAQHRQKLESAPQVATISTHLQKKCEVCAKNIIIRNILYLKDLQ
jgi:hypothetical protein